MLFVESLGALLNDILLFMPMFPTNLPLRNSTPRLPQELLLYQINPIACISTPNERIWLSARPNDNNNKMIFELNRIEFY